MPPMTRLHRLAAAGLASGLAGLVGTRNARRLLWWLRARLIGMPWRWSLLLRGVSEWCYPRLLSVPAFGVLLLTLLAREP